ncbi:MAG: hypothetical protein V4492_07105 [Chlamydiota bacterium]
MVELSSLRKNKINLEDYHYKQDIENRLLMAQFTSVDIAVLEEILYSSIKIPVRKLAKSADLDEKEILPILKKLSDTGLFAFEGDSIVVDKEMRKYFENQILKFDPDFTPGMDFLQSLLRKVPIHVLPVWYSIPRTSNNIFDSLVEKYLLTPQIFQRYLMELHFPDPILNHIVRDVFESPDLKVYGNDLIAKYELTREKFEEYLLLLEYNFACFIGYEKIADEWHEIVTPFHEWREYTAFLKATETPSIATPQAVIRYRPEDFSFVHDISQLLTLAKKQPIELSTDKEGRFSLNAATLPLIAAKLKGWSEKDLGYLHRLIVKIRMIKLAEIVDGRLYALESATDWLEMRPENQGMYLHRHPLNRITNPHVPADMITDRTLRESEKSIVRILNSGWVYFDEFIRGVIAPLGEDSIIMLKKLGRTWKYNLPSYKEEEVALIKAVVLDWLFEVGVTAIGTHEGKECFCVTEYGQSLFGR